VSLLGPVILGSTAPVPSMLAGRRYGIVTAPSQLSRRQAWSSQQHELSVSCGRNLTAVDAGQAQLLAHLQHRWRTVAHRRRRCSSCRRDCPRPSGPRCGRSRTRRRCRGDAQLEAPWVAGVDSASLTSPHPSGLDPAQNGPDRPAPKRRRVTQGRSGRASAPTAQVAGIRRRGGCHLLRLRYGSAGEAGGRLLHPRVATAAAEALPIAGSAAAFRLISRGAECWTKQAHRRCCTGVVASPFARRCWR
jgi:hypothetical protein